MQLLLLVTDDINMLSFNSVLSSILIVDVPACILFLLLRV
jgi:hypothetical protein